MTLARITQRFAALAKAKRTGLITYNMAYDPDYETSFQLLTALPAAGADFIEIGMPFSDPMADGPSIANAGIRALKAGAKLRGVLGMVQRFRENNTTIPIILMGYYNPLLHYGLEAFVKDAAAAGIDGLLIVDLPPEEDETLYQLATAQKLALIKLITPTTDTARLKTILPKASGFLYYVAVAGITGTKSATSESVQQALAQFRPHTSLPIAVGFGIRTPEQAAAIAPYADAVVVGSALVELVAKHRNNPSHAMSDILQLTRSLAGALC